MIYLQSFVSAIISTALIIVLARVILSAFLADARHYVPALCIGIGYLLGRYSFTASATDGTAAVKFLEFFGSVTALLIMWYVFRYRAARADAA